ncbi:MAG TPA: hypothetical protein VN956_02270, partial [Pyrinomonadaceae bacterium]|nr:hypothetical protein [Pyrinomonadaceae bacterium]
MVRSAPGADRGPRAGSPGGVEDATGSQDSTRPAGDPMMSDAEFITRFENCTLRGEDFHHRDHIKVVWLYLRYYSVLETLDRFSAGLKRFATANGKPNLYHETITWAY